MALNQKGLYDNKLPLGVFLEPEILLNTLRQKTCRQVKKPLDDLEMKVCLGDDIPESPFTFKIGDLVLEGGKMGKVGVTAAANAKEKEPLDYVCIGFVDKSQAPSGDGVVELPIYLTSNKEIMLTRVKVPFEGDKNDVLLAGCSFYI
jgi:hypothetical protein